VPNQGSIELHPEARSRFDTLFDTHYLMVSRYCLRRLGAADGEDAAAEVFAIAWRRLDQVPAEEATRAWLLAVAYRVVGNQYRSRRRRNRLSARLLTEVSVDRQPALDDEARLVQETLDSLKKDDREILRMAAWDGLSRSEMATVIGIKENAVDQRLFRARARFKERFDRLNKSTPQIDPREASA
jgi:RNA polymerase sigma-70 factor, ECF subfamily